ncbi:restriction endonuclease FokI C-terminal domain-containing protein [Mucilaginibacter sp. 10B2]|uniref:restriction endonuclease FokI C-terminal domain-containing protein n=1 Tax=Mucilaginibacter sp. 10B2 TaxID=3048574 RepID=UPI002B22732C|nr:restriction endonuclease FokI C-terminal domain-containing protein [Mucilaginibacter sp. 10B2]MEB0277196.1 restriction endonuclease FokI C-terminal domain-containing protein [Mucilaginibacter sp. 10B2]
MNFDKEAIKEEYLKLKLHLGRQPGSKEFYKETGISEYQVVQNFHKYTSLIAEMGDSQKSFGEKYYDVEEYWNNYGDLARKLNKVPSSSEWLFHKCKLLKTSFFKKFGKNWSELPPLFYSYAINKPEWSDIIHFFSSEKESELVASIDNNPQIEFKYLQFLPPILNDFLTFSTQEGKNNEFEKQVNLVFQMLGFDTNYFGQGTGRNPDSIAKASQFGYALLIDAKARKEAYQIGTEDRKFIEYIKTHSSNLNRTGHGIIYFVIVSSEFKSITESSLKNIMTETNVVTTLFKASTLLKLLSKKIEYPSTLNLESIKGLFLNSGIITDKEIDRLLIKLKVS